MNQDTRRTRGNDRRIDSRLGDLAARQGGVFTWEHARDAGLPAEQVMARLETGQWFVVFPGVYRASTTKPTREVMAMAGLLYAGRRALFSHFTAARLWRIDVAGWSVGTWITVPHNRQIPSCGDLVIKRTRATPVRSEVAGYPVTSVARTVVDLASELRPPQLAAVVHDVVRRGAASPEQILGVADRLRGRRGVARVRRVMDEFDPMYESNLEQEADEHLTAAGIILEKQVEVYEDGWFVARLDFADRTRKLAIMIDGFRWHSTRKAINRDREQERALIRLRWTVLRFTTDDVRRRPQRMVQEVLAQLERLAAA